MSIKQQDIVNEIMKIKNLTKAQFAAEHNVSARALTNWLMDENSPEYRNMPSLVKADLENKLIGLINSDVFCTEIESCPPHDYGQSPFVMLIGEKEIIFPTVYFETARYDVSEFKSYPDYHLIEGLQPDDTCTVEELTLTPSLKNNAQNFISKQAISLDKAASVNGNNYWINLTHYVTAGQAQAACDMVFSLQSEEFTEDESLCNTAQIVRFNNEYFFLHLVQAPAWYDAPLICYHAKGLHKVLGFVEYEVISEAVNASGDRISIPRNTEF